MAGEAGGTIRACTQVPYCGFTLTVEWRAKARTSSETRVRLAVACRRAWRTWVATWSTGRTVRLVTWKTSHCPVWVCSGVTGTLTATEPTWRAVSTWDSGKLQPSWPPFLAEVASVEVDVASGATVTAPAWNGTTGGILAIDVGSGNLDVEGTITMTGGTAVTNYIGEGGFIDNVAITSGNRTSLNSNQHTRYGF